MSFINKLASWMGIHSDQERHDAIKRRFKVGESITYLGRECIITRTSIMVYGGPYAGLTVEYSNNHGDIIQTTISYEIVSSLPPNT
jgi:hypothetical protein